MITTEDDESVVDLVDNNNLFEGGSVSSTDQYNVSISTVKMMFTHSAVKKRAHLFACNIINEKPFDDENEEYKANHLYKGMFNLCYELLTKEYNFIRSQVRICQKRKLRKIRKARKKRELTKYTLFCRELKAKFPHEELVGKMHQKWSEYKNENNQLKLQAMKRPKKEDDIVILSSEKLTYDNGDIISDTSSDDE